MRSGAFKRAFVKAVLEENHLLGFFDGFFYLKPVKSVLVGLSCDFGPSGLAYFYRYAFPLYDCVERPTLTFGERLPSPHNSIDTRGLSAENLGNELLQRIETYKEVCYRETDLIEFKISLEKKATTNIWYTRAYALTLIKLGNFPGAQSTLQFLLLSPAIERYSEFRDVIQTVSAELEFGVERAAKLLLDWERRTKEKFRIDRGGVD